MVYNRPYIQRNAHHVHQKMQKANSDTIYNDATYIIF